MISDPNISMTVPICRMEDTIVDINRRGYTVEKSIIVDKNITLIARKSIPYPVQIEFTRKKK